MVELLMYDEGSVIMVYIPAQYADLPLHVLAEKGLIFVEVQNETK